MKRIALFGALLISAFAFSWGYRLHYEIARTGIPLLEEKMGKGFTAYADIIARISDLPDRWKTSDPGESPNHYMDYEEFLARPKVSPDSDFEDIKKAYGTGFLKDNGTVVWAIESYAGLLKQAFEKKDYIRIAVYSAVLAHYIGDLHQPLHATRNYDGQLTGNKGIHSRFEATMINLYWKRGDGVEAEPEDIGYGNIRKFAIGIVEESLAAVERILDADDMARGEDPLFSADKYYKILWDELRELTYDRFSKAAKRYADLIYTIYLAGGKPALEYKELPDLSEHTQVDKPKLLSSPRSTYYERKNDKLFAYMIGSALVFVCMILLLKKM